MGRKEKWVTICPKCGSTDISPESNAVYAGFNQYKQCENCGHHGIIFPQVPKSKAPKKPKSPEKVKEPLMVQTAWGEGYFKYYIYLLLPLTIFMDIALWRFGYLYSQNPVIVTIGIFINLAVWLLGTVYLLRGGTKSQAPHKGSC